VVAFDGFVGIDGGVLIQNFSAEYFREQRNFGWNCEGGLNVTVLGALSTDVPDVEPL